LKIVTSRIGIRAKAVSWAACPTGAGAAIAGKAIMENIAAMRQTPHLRTIGRSFRILLGCDGSDPPA
jgi:hypothetical protein